MSQFRFARAGLLVAALGLSTVPAVFGLVSPAYAQALRPEVGKPLQEAANLMKSKKYKEALAKVKEADAVGGKTPAEQLIIDRTRASAAQMAGEYDTAAKAFEAVLASGKVSGSEAATINKALVSLYFQTRNYQGAINAINKILKEGDDPAMRGYLIQAYYQLGDFAKVKTEVAASIAAAEKAGRAPNKDEIGMLANAALKGGDKAGYVTAIEKLVTYYPDKTYWADLLNRVASKPGFSERLVLDVFRLKFAAGLVKSSSDYMEMAQLSLQAKAPHEALKIIDAAYKSGAFGSGNEAERQKRLKALAEKSAAETLANADALQAEAQKNKDGMGLANLGFALVSAGKADKGLPMFEEALKTDGMKRADDVKLHQGIALINAGKKSEAVKVLKSVGGTDGTAELARYWLLQLKSA